MAETGSEPPRVGFPAINRKANSFRRVGEKTFEQGEKGKNRLRVGLQTREATVFVPLLEVREPFFRDIEKVPMVHTRRTRTRTCSETTRPHTQVISNV